MAIKILLVDDHPLFRWALSQLLAGMPDFKVVGDVDDGKHALDFIAAHPVDLIILDLQMPQGNGVEFLTELEKRMPHPPKVLVVSQISEGPIWQSVRTVNIDGFVLKVEGVSEIEAALQAIRQGRSYFSPGVGNRLWNGSDDKTVRQPDIISDREKQVAKLVSQGLSTQEIASTLGCAASTIKTHRVNLMRKIGLKNSAEVTRWALSNPD